MSEYPRRMSQPTITRYGHFEIAVRTSADAASLALDEFTAAYEISVDGEKVSRGHVVGAHPSAHAAAKNAMRIAKEIIFEAHDGPDPAAD